MKNRTKLNVIISTILLLFMGLGMTTTYAQDKDDAKKQKKIVKQKKKINEGHAEGLKELYELDPSARGKIASAYGYAVFTNVGVNLFVLSSGNGSGLLVNNRSGGKTYMKMISFGAGVGIGLKSYYGIFIFDNSEVFNDFLDNGWSADGQADATADTGEEGGGVSLAMNIAPGVILYQIADKGLAAQATVQGTKFLVDDDLN